MHSDVGSPEDVVVAVLRARDVMDYERVVALADRASVVRAHERHCEIYRRPTLEQFARDRTDLAGDQVGKVFEATLRHIAASEKLIANLVPDVHSHAELLALDPGDFLLRVLRKADFRLDLIRRMRERGRPVALDFSSATTPNRYLLLGAAPEEPDVTHVMYRVVTRNPDGAEYVSDIEIMSTCRQRDGTWRALVSSLDFLQSRNSTATILDEQFHDLFDEHELEWPRDRACRRMIAKLLGEHVEDREGPPRRQRPKGEGTEEYEDTVRRTHSRVLAVLRVLPELFGRGATRASMPTQTIPLASRHSVPVRTASPRVRIPLRQRALEPRVVAVHVAVERDDAARADDRRAVVDRHRQRPREVHPIRWTALHRRLDLRA